MKTVFKTFLVCLLFNSSYAQTVAFAADKMNVLYIGVDNPITIVAENTDCSKIKVSTNNGTIEGRNCYYIVRPKEVGVVNVTVQIKGNRKVSVMPFRAKRLPDPIFEIGSGKKRVSVTEIKNQEFVRAVLQNDLAICGNTSVDSFTVCAFSKDTCIFKEIKNIGNKLSDEVKELFNKLMPEDVIIFKYIYSKWPDGEPMKLEPVVITVY